MENQCLWFGTVGDIRKERGEGMKILNGFYACLILMILMTGCSSKDPILGEEEVDTITSWMISYEDDNTIQFTNGVKLVLPDTWVGKVVYEEVSGNSDASTLWICEKEAAEAGLGGNLLRLTFEQKKDDNSKIYLFDQAKVLGIYSGKEGEYILICEPSREGAYIESKKEYFFELFEHVNEVQVITDSIENFHNCDAKDVD